MKTIRNRTRRPLRIPLPGGKTLHLGPAKEGQVAAAALERPALKKLVDAGDIEVVGEGAHPEGGAPSSSPHESTHGGMRPGVVRPKGDR